MDDVAQVGGKNAVTWRDVPTLTAQGVRSTQWFCCYRRGLPEVLDAKQGRGQNLCMGP